MGDGSLVTSSYFFARAFNISGVIALPPAPQFPNSTSSIMHHTWGRTSAFSEPMPAIHSATVSETLAISSALCSGVDAPLKSLMVTSGIFIPLFVLLHRVGAEIPPEVHRGPQVKPRK